MPVNLARTVAAEPLRVLDRERVDLWRALDPVRREIDDVLAPRPLQRGEGIRRTGEESPTGGAGVSRIAVLLDPCQGVADRAPI